MSLYLKYRPQKIEELDLTNVRNKLQEIIKSNQLGHAYLLTGPRGAGKTSTARILARVVNCEKNNKKLDEPCNKCEACLSILEGRALDVIEIDAASNRGIDDIRELKEKIRLAPSVLPTKVYVIDEVHMLTTEAFNALLKTLEEPPSHSLFILCTTELHKVPETIISRCIQIQFSKASPEEMKRSFARVAKGEGKTLSEEALEFLALAVDGSFRDGVKILDQALSVKDKIEKEDVETLITGSAGYTVLPFVTALVKKNAQEAIYKLDEAMKAGVDVSYLLVSTMRALRDGLLANLGIGTNPLGIKVELGVTDLIYKLDKVASSLSGSLDSELLIQTVIVEWCGEAEGGDKEEEEEEVEEKREQSKEDASKVWQDLLKKLNGDSVTLGTLLSTVGSTTISGDELTISVPYDFHRQQIMSEKVLAKLEKLVSEQVGRAVKVNCILETKAPLKKNDTIDQAMQIFM